MTVMQFWRVFLCMNCFWQPVYQTLRTINCTWVQHVCAWKIVRIWEYSWYECMCVWLFVQVREQMSHRRVPQKHYKPWDWNAWPVSIDNGGSTNIDKLVGYVTSSNKLSLSFWLKTETTGNGDALKYESIDEIWKKQPLETASAKNVRENSA